MQKNEYDFTHCVFEYKLVVSAKSKVGAVKIVRLLVQDPEKWFLTEIRSIRDCSIPIRAIETDAKAMSPKDSIDETKKRK